MLEQVSSPHARSVPCTPPGEVDDGLPGQPGEGVVDRARPTRTHSRLAGGDLEPLVALERGVEAAYVGGRGPNVA